MLFVCFIRFGVGEHFYFVYVFFFFLMIRPPPRSTQSSRRQRQMCIRDRRIENATDNPISYGATLRTTQRMDEDAWRLRGRRGEGPDTACLAAVDTTTGRWVGMMSGQMRSRT